MALIRESEFSRGYFVGGLELGDCFGGGGGYDDEDDGDDDGKKVGDGGGGNASDNNNNIIEKREKKMRVGNPDDDSELSSSSSSPPSSSSSSSPASSPAAWKLEEGGREWYGDRIEILVGSGDVYLQFEDEDENPFFCGANNLKKDSEVVVGFWKFFFSL